MLRIFFKPQVKQKVVKPAWAQVEGIIGTINSNKYKFNKPGARSITAMESCGHRSILGSNLIKMMKENKNLLLESMGFRKLFERPVRWLGKNHYSMKNAKNICDFETKLPL